MEKPTDQHNYHVAYLAGVRRVYAALIAAGASKDILEIARQEEADAVAALAACRVE